MPISILISLEASSRQGLLHHASDCFSFIVDLFSATTRTLLSHNKNRSLSRSIDNLKQAVETERELYSNVRGQLDRESFEKNSVEKMSHQAVEWCEYWRKRASDNAQELQEMTEAKDLAHDAALFWKARCVCATAALKQLTEGSGTFDYSAYGANMASLLKDEISVPTRGGRFAAAAGNSFSLREQLQPAQRGSSQTKKDYKDKKSKHHHQHRHSKKYHQRNDSDDNDEINESREQQRHHSDGKVTQSQRVLDTVLPVRLRHPDLFRHVDEGQNFATNYLYHNTQQHPSHKPSRF